MILTEYNNYGNLGYLNILKTAGIHFQYGEFRYFYICDFFYNAYRLDLKIFSFDTNIYGDDDDDNDYLLYFNSKQYSYL